MPRLVYVVTHPLTADKLLRGQLAALRTRFDVVLVTAPGPGLPEIARREGVEVATVPMSREMRPAADLVSLLRLVRLLRRLRPDVVNAGTPKAGLLGMLAAWLARVPVRVYTLRGLRLETTTGARRRLLLATERVAAACSHRVVAVGPSLRRRCVELGIAAADKVSVLGEGSSNGVDPARFGAALPPGEAARRRGELGIPAGAPVVGFVGRLTRDKGITELAAAFAAVAAQHPDARLLLLGEFEEGDPVPSGVVTGLRRDPRVVMAGFVPDPAAFYPLIDVLAFPSHREGFPNVPLEAAAAGVPTVGCRVTGTVDAVVDGETGILVQPGDTAALAAALAAYLADPALARRHGEAARARVERHFRHQRVSADWQALYGSLLAARGAGGSERGAPGAEPPPGRGVRGWYRRYGKRLLDLALLAAAAPFALPLLAATALAVRWRLGAPVLFRQRRPGLGGRPFTIYKLRTMRDARDAAGLPLPDEARLTRLGALLRGASLDELPELWNVLRGEMSLVGPRPLLMEYLDRYTPRQARRHEVRPGLTGWAQVHGRNTTSWEERLALDVAYVDRLSLALDLRILAATVLQVLRRQGISAPGHATMPPFEGTVQEETVAGESVPGETVPELTSRGGEER